MSKRTYPVGAYATASHPMGGRGWSGRIFTRVGIGMAAVPAWRCPHVHEGPGDARACAERELAVRP